MNFEEEYTQQDLSEIFNLDGHITTATEVTYTPEIEPVLLDLKNRIISKTDGFLTDVGSHFHQAKTLLANHKNGTFEKFVQECGYNVRTVDRLIARFNLITTSGRNIQYLENLPIRVAAAAGAKNADPELREKVITGEISTIKQMEAWKEEKKKLQAEKEYIMNQRDQLAREKVSLEMKLAKKPTEVIREVNVYEHEAVERARLEERQRLEAEYQARIKEESRNLQQSLQDSVRQHEAMVARLEEELTILRPLKKREDEIIAKQKELDQAREEVFRSKMRNQLFDAVTKARKTFNDAIYPVVTVSMTPDVIGDTLRAELNELVKMTENFTFAVKQKFNL